MDSDVSADGDVKSDHSEDAPSSPDVNSDEESSSSESSPAAHRNSSAGSSPAAHKNSSAEHSPAAHKTSSAESSPVVHKANSSATSSPARRRRTNSSRDSSPDAKAASSDRDSSPDSKASDHESSPPNSPANSDVQDSQDEETKASASPYRESSPDLKESESLPAGDAVESSYGVSPDRDVDSPEAGHNPLSPDADYYHGSDPEQSPVEAKRESSPDAKNRVSDRELSPDAERGSSSDIEHEKYRSQSPDGAPYKRVNGNVSPKRSNSVVSEGRSDIGSLDSVSPTQFEQHDENRMDYDDAECGENAERMRDKKQAIIDFADDLSDVSDVESNESFGGQEKEEKTDEGEEEPEEEKKAESVHDEIVHDQPNGEGLDDKHEDAVSLHVDGEEQLDFEAEEGEVSPKPEKKAIKEEDVKHEVKEQSDLEEGELSDDADAKPEETERPICRFFSRGHCTWGSNCRFIHPGVMDKGNYSMFETVRPIVTPGGPPNPGAPVVYPGFPPHMVPPHIAAERAALIPPGGPRKEEATSESAWERGLRQAKEMIRKSSKRKETEVDFEDKKMNLTLSQDEIDKENDYYSRHSGSPPIKSPDLADKWKMEADAKAHRAEGYPNDGPGPAGPHGADVPPLGYYPPMHHGMSRPEYWNHHRMGGLPYDEYGLRGPHVPYGPDYYSPAGRRYMHPNSYYPPRPGVAGPPPPHHHPDFYDRKQKHKPYPGSSREVIVQKNDKPYKDERYRGRREESPRADRGRDDEWADPWMRTKSPASGRRRRRRKNTYSSGSSYSSSSESSRSSGRSSGSSRSRSRSKERSSHSGTHSSSRSASETQAGKKPPMQFKLSPTSRQLMAGPKKNAKVAPSPALMADRRAANERTTLMNPVAASPKVKTRPHSPPTGMAASTNSPLKAKGGLPDRLLAHSKAAVVAAMRSTRSSESRSSKSSSGSSSSDTASDSSDSSGSSSSSSKSSKTPPVARVQKRSVEDHSSSAQMVKGKAMDALKLSGQKQQIKLTLKGSSAQTKRGAADNVDNRKERLTLAGKKRAADSSDSGSDSDTPAKKSKANQKRGGAPSRREELLKQLRAVEDAIARKRSKNV